MEQLKEGDVVYLKSGGAQMTIDYIAENKAACVWYDNNNVLHTEKFQLTSLTKNDPRPPLTPSWG